MSKAIGLTENNILFTKAAQQSLQGQWTRWERIVQRDMSFHRLLRTSPKLLSFTLGVTFGTIASPTNLKRWGLSDDESCPLCDVKKCTLSHVLSACKPSLASGRYSFRHDLVLKSICHSIQSFINKYCKSKRSVTSTKVSFVKEGATCGVSSARFQLSGILNDGSDWELLADIDKRLKFPCHIDDTDLRPDIVIYSNARRILIIIELTCPCEQNIDSAHISKTERYSDLVARCKRAGWIVHFFAVEVGARGYASVSLKVCLANLGLAGKKLKEALNDASVAASKGSFWIWMKRSDPEWDSRPADNQRKNRFQRPKSRPVESANLSTSNIPRSVARLPRGIVNMGNSCFVSASLQMLKPVWNFLEINETDPFSGALCRTMSDLSVETTSPLYPLSLLTEVRRNFRNFARNTFEDAHEFLQVVLNKVKCDKFNLLMVTHTVCQNCQYFTLEDVEILGIHLTLWNLLSDSLSAFFQYEEVAWQCTGCSQKTLSGKTYSALHLPDILLLQLK